MTKTMRIELYFSGGGYIDREITYTGDNLTEIAKDIDTDENDLLVYLNTGETNGNKAFCFRGFMVRKDGIIAGRISEPIFE